jgi:hypothetical protein
MGGFDTDAARTAFNIPAEFIPMAAMALGYQGAAETLNESFRDIELAERKRQPLGSCFFAGTWDNPIG